jgi:HAD superfamily hydrolase (TIGR01662 family)
MTYQLYIFDLDGTLAERDSTRLLPGVAEWFAAHPDAITAIATNQGGVACRLAGWGDHYPTEADVLERAHAVAKKLGIFPLLVGISYAYQTKAGQWLDGDMPQVEVTDTWIAWQRDWRKPSPGMLLAAMRYVNVRPHNTIMVGDRDEDRAAAEAAGCAFTWAEDFFGGWR